MERRKNDMRRKLVDSSNWQRVLDRRYKQTIIENEKYKGYVSLVYIDKVTEPLVVSMHNKKYCLADDGYRWVKFVPQDLNYAAIAIYNDRKEIIEWYFDITRRYGINDQGKLYFDDLYLDVVVLPQGEIFLLDEDELKEALEKGIITNEEYNLAYRQAKDLMDEIKNNNNYIIKSSNEYLDYLLSL